MKRHQIGLIAVTLALCLVGQLQASVFSSKGFQLDLYSSFEFEYQWEEEGNGDPNGSFDVDQFDIAFSYSRDSWRLALDLVVEHGVSTEDGRGNVAISWGFAEYAFSDALKFRAGKFLTAFGIQNEFNTVRSGFLTVKNPLSNYKARKLTDNGFAYFPRRQAGIGITGGKAGDSGYAQWDLVLTNGAQDEDNPFEEDNNSQKAINGRLNFEPDFADNTTFGISGYYDTMSDGDVDASLWSLGFSFDYQSLSWIVRSEVFTGSLDPDDSGATDQTSAYLDVGYQVGNVTPYVEAQWVQTSKGDLDEEANVFVVGVFYRFKTAAVIKLENAYIKGNDENLKTRDLPGHDYNELRAAFVVGF